MSGASGPVVQARGLVKRFEGLERDVLSGIDLDVHPGDRLALVGPSGSGKSTLLYLLGLLDTPTAGSLTVAGRDVASLSDGERTALRRDTVGFVFQDHHLLPQCTALENVLVPLLADRRRARPEAVVRARSLLADLGLGDRLSHRPAALSTGQRQRVAVARALVRQPALILADEPTGSLDRSLADGLLERLLVEAGDAAVVMVTHDPVAAERLGRVVRLEDGRLVGGAAA